MVWWCLACEEKTCSPPRQLYAPGARNEANSHLLLPLLLPLIRLSRASTRHKLAPGVLAFLPSCCTWLRPRRDAITRIKMSVELGVPKRTGANGAGDNEVGYAPYIGQRARGRERREGRTVRRVLRLDLLLLALPIRRSRRASASRRRSGRRSLLHDLDI